MKLKRPFSGICVVTESQSVLSGVSPSFESPYKYVNWVTGETPCPVDGVLLFYRPNAPPPTSSSWTDRLVF